MQTTHGFVKAHPVWAVVVALCLMAASASAQLSFTSGVNSSASSNGNYAAVQFYNFSDSGGTGAFATGTQNNLNGVDYVTWVPESYAFTYVYSPSTPLSEIYLITASEGVGRTIPIPSQPATELQITDKNTGIGDLTLTLTSINSVADGTENFAAGTSWSAANGETLQAYLDDPTLFASGFTLSGTITLDTPANSTDYGDGLNSLIQFNLAEVPEPSTCWLVGIGLGALAIVLRRRIAARE